MNALPHGIETTHNLSANGTFWDFVKALSTFLGKIAGLLGSVIVFLFSAIGVLLGLAFWAVIIGIAVRILMWMF